MGYPVRREINKQTNKPSFRKKLDRVPCRQVMHPKQRRDLLEGDQTKHTFVRAYGGRVD